MNLIYCYDAYCGWCFGFSPVIKKIAQEYKNIFFTEVLSGGMILPEHPVHIGAMADYIAKAYKTVEEYSGIRFGEDYLWHIFNPDQSDWFPNSEKPAIAFCVFKEYFPDKQADIASDLQNALHIEGRDLTDDEAYKHLIEKYNLDSVDFFNKLNDSNYKEKAHYEFALCKQLKANGYPYLLLQPDESKFYLVAKGYTPYDVVKSRLTSILNELKTI